MRMHAALVFLGAPLARSDADPGWELFATTTGPELPMQCTSASGIPASARGSYFVGGPAVFEVGDYSLQAFFDGYGKINRFDILEDKICYKGKVMNTSVLATSRSRGYPAGMQFEDTAPLRPKCSLSHPMCEMSVLGDNQWVNSIVVGGELRWLSDSYLMLDFDAESLDIVGPVPWADDSVPAGGVAPGAVPNWVSAGHIATTGSAHPLLRPGTTTYIDIVTEMAMMPWQQSYLTVYSFDGGVKGPQNRSQVASLPLDFGPYMHSFGVTPNYVILPLNVGVAVPNFRNPLLLGKISPHFKGVALVDFKGKVTYFTPKEFFHVHIVNSFENETGVTLDLGAADENPFVRNPGIDTAEFLNKTARDNYYNTTKNCVRRFHFHLTGALEGQVTEEDLLCQGFVDFYRIHPERSGLPYCIYYGTQWYQDFKTRANMTVFKHNICTGELTKWHRDNVYPGEPSLIATGPGEEDGLLSFVALNGEKRKSEYVLLDAKTFAEVAVVQLPEHIPFTAHGQFVPSKKVLV